MAGRLSPLVELSRRVPWNRIRWDRVWQGAVWLYGVGRRRLEANLSRGERQELAGLMRKSKARRRNLSEREQKRFVELVRKGVVGRR